MPEDDTNRQIANGFFQNPELNIRAIQILPIIGRWQKTVDTFKNVHVHEMRKYPERRIVLVIDFDNDLGRLESIKCQIPEELFDRVFVLGVLSEPEKLKANLHYKGLEEVGMSLSKDCSDNIPRTWRHEMLKHNKAELDRLNSLVKPFLFS